MLIKKILSEADASYQELCSISGGNCKFGEVSLACQESFDVWKSLENLNIYNENYDDRDMTLDDLVILTAFSGNHLEESR